MEKTLSLYKLMNGQAAPFPSAADQIVLTAFTATYQRMGAAPYITATVKYSSCLDGQWDDVFVELRGERFFVRNEPGSEKDNTDVRFIHTVTFQSERAALDEIYMIDAVQPDSTVDGYKSNDVKVQFMGDIDQWASRLNDAFAYTGLYDSETEEGYQAVVDDGVTSEDKLVSFEQKFISEALQEGFKVFGIPYYFVGKTIHFGYVENAITDPVEYGCDNALIRVGRANANIKLANRMSGYGSSDNIPYYYPNLTPLGEVELDVDSTATVSIRSTERLSTRIGHFPLHFGWRANDVGNQVVEVVFDEYSDTRTGLMGGTERAYDGGVADIEFDQTFVLESATKSSVAIVAGLDWKMWCYTYDHYPWTIVVDEHDPHIDSVEALKVKNVSTGTEYTVGSGVLLPAGEYKVIASVHIVLDEPFWYIGAPHANVTLHYAVQDGVWLNNQDYPVDMFDLGLNVSGQATVGDTVALEVVHRIETLGRLMPPIYRTSLGQERFYNALNNTYPHPDGGYYVFANEYSENNRRELIMEFEDIKPTITGVTNQAGQRIDKFLAFAWDTDDNDEYDQDGNYLHPYFFAKLARTNGDYGFNLFDCATDNPMQVSFTSGTCGACKFEVGVDKDTKKNTVQVDSSGNLLRDSYGDVRCGREGKPQETFLDRQQDTSANAVWIALKKDNTTYPAIMPSYRRNLTPTSDDTFVLLNITMPYAYITAAEERLKAAIIDYMSKVNSPLFNPSISFSRIFFEEQPSFLSSLNENTRLSVKYNGITYSYYISNFTYTMAAGEILPEVSVDLIEEITAVGNSLQTKLDALKDDVLASVSGRDALRQTLSYFLRKDVEDSAKETINFQKGTTFGKFTSGQLGSGGAVRVTEDGGTTAEFDYLNVRKKAVFAELVVDKEQAVEGNVVITPAGVVITRVEENTDSYRCYFQKTDNDGSVVYNPFIVDDLARCQTFNLVNNRYYWRKVVGVGSDYIDLSKITGEYDGSDVPMAGDNVIQLGNTSDTDRQSAIAISSYGTNSPSLKMYHGINSFNLSGKDMFGVEYDATTGYPRFYNYGAMRLGARDDEQGGYIVYDHEAKTLNISAIVNFLSGSTGLTDLPDYQKLVAIANGNIENWFYDNAPTTPQIGAPTLSNYPANTWEVADYTNHIGDIYYDDKGQGYRFKLTGTTTYGWQVLENQELSYLTAALEQSTTIVGGLVLTSEINLGYKDANEVYHIMSGISGMGDDPTAVAAWYGGTKQNAKSLFRFDGTGFLAGGNISWDEDGHGWVGGSGEDDDYAVKWDADGIHLGGGITLGASDKDVETLVEYMSYFQVVSIPGVGNALKLNPDRFVGFFTDGFLSGNGASTGTGGGGGGASTLRELNDVLNNGSAVTREDGTAAQDGDLFVYDVSTHKWCAIAQSSISPEVDLSEYLKKTEASSTYQPIIDAAHKLAANLISGLASVATTGSYSDLSNKPTKSDFGLGNVENKSAAQILADLTEQMILDALSSDKKGVLNSGATQALIAQITTNKNNITGLGTRMGTAETSITGLGTRMTAAEGDIDAAQADIIAILAELARVGVLADKLDSWFGYDASKNMVYVKNGTGASGSPANRGFFTYGALSGGGASINTEGGGGGGGDIPHVFLTQAEYDALGIKDPDTLYFTYEED